jgi:hypothetical protein
MISAPHRRPCTLLLAAALLAGPSIAAPAWAADPGHGPGLEVGAVGLMLHDGHHALVGGGAFVEFHLLPHLLHLELTGAAGQAGDDSVVLLDLVFKYPYQLTDRVELFGGAGLTVPFVSRPTGGTEARPGLTLTAGAFYWFMPPMGLLGAGVFNVLSSGEGAHVEGGLVLGVALQL